MTARDAMTPAPLTVTPRTSNRVEQGAARRLLHHGAPEALVTEDERLVGILTHSDRLRAFFPKEPEAAA